MDFIHTYESYTYVSTGGKATSQIQSYYSSVNSNYNDYTFSYDKNGNISAIYNGVDGSLIVSYTYDHLNRLVREDNQTLSRTYVYSYDLGGNITSKKTYYFTTGTLGTAISTQTYSYTDSNWRDKLTAINGSSITYDNSGNPLSYYNGSSYTFTWTQGRQLATAVKGSNTLSFSYNENGVRTYKTVNGVKHEYVVDGTKIIAEKWGTSGVRHFVTYLYDATGVIGMTYRTSTMSTGEYEVYIFDKNLQGDITAVYSVTGTLLVQYKYDAWGNVTTSYINGGASTGAQYNAMRYRGYFYDSELNLYYLNSRYYDPATGRFLNADIYVNANGDLSGYNMFAYCSNNPVSYVDPSGTALYTFFGDGFELQQWYASSNGGGSVGNHVSLYQTPMLPPELIYEIRNLDWENTNEYKVLNAKYISAYKGTLVIKIDAMENNGFSFGAIVLGNGSKIDANTVKHEYGHKLQLDKMGWGKYITDVAIPSLTINILSRMKKLPYDYYTYPWEAEADSLGGVVNREYKKPSLPNGEYNSYFDLIELFFK